MLIISSFLIIPLLFLSFHFPIHSSLLSPLLLGTITFKSLFFMDPVTSRIDAEFESNGEDLPFYSRISLGECCRNTYNDGGNDDDVKMVVVIDTDVDNGGVDVGDDIDRVLVMMVA